ncbi:hypothetical protein ACFFQF_05925 [Haladaptatus pallidirubidus]|uniref:Outer membrane lipoprotein-sorting protein n=1 Tax=Haladaptatus pallidirubidus TaxID=1008152 RepID=A0AAV3ULW4_9EURY|nr:hypothetical protein [Haladaptatus pallidirubidus]
MNLRPAFALLTAMLLVAGCVGGPANDAGTPTAATETGTPTATLTTETTTPTTPLEPSLPTGISDDGSVNASRLISAHESALEETGYEFEYRSVTEAGGEANTTTHWGTVAEGRTSFVKHAEYTTDSSSEQYGMHLWANGSVLLTKQVVDGQTNYNERAQDDHLRQQLASVATMTETLDDLLASGEFEVTKTDRSSGQSFVTLSATEPTDDSQFENATEFDATLVVDSSGRVHEFHRTVTTDRVRLEQNFELSFVDTTSVERPQWADDARAVLTANVEVSTSKNAIELEHESGDTLAADSTVRIEHGGETHVLEFGGTFKSGERVFIYYPADGDAPVLVADEPTDVNAERIEGEYSLTVLGPNGNTVTAMGFGVGYSDESSHSS